MNSSSNELWISDYDYGLLCFQTLDYCYALTNALNFPENDDFFPAFAAD